MLQLFDRSDDDLVIELLCSFSSSAADRVVYHYSRSLHGFAARLTDDERNRLAGKHTQARSNCILVAATSVLDPIYIHFQ